MMLEIVAKCENGLFKKLSYFRLEIYKKYGALYTAKIKTVENSVESVEIHPKNKRQRWTFARSPQGFQHVEKTGPFYGLYTGRLVENFLLWANRRITARRFGNTTLRPGWGSG